MNKADYSLIPPTSEHSYICTDPLCEYCYLTRVKHKSKPPVVEELPFEIRNLIDDSGGWVKFKAEALLENSRTLKRDEIRRYKLQINHANRLLKLKQSK